MGSERKRKISLFDVVDDSSSVVSRLIHGFLYQNSNVAYLMTHCPDSPNKRLSSHQRRLSNVEAISNLGPFQTVKWMNILFELECSGQHLFDEMLKIKPTLWKNPRSASE
ncbi:hypothetical protein LguiB_001448 [Lonicera macranthoides]